MIACLLLVAAAAPQSAPGTILIDRNRVDRNIPVAPPPAAASATPKVATAIKGAPNVAIKGIRFLGARAPTPVAAAARRFLGRRASRQVLSELAVALSTAYGRSAVALYTVVIPDQTFAGGVVAVRLVEGRIARAQVRTDKPDAFPLLRARMARLTRNRTLTRRTYERQMTLIGAIPGTTVQTQITDPAGTGALVLTATPKQKRTRVTAGFSNRGVDLLGDGQFDIKGEAFGIGTDGDQLTVAASAASDLERFRYLSAGYNAPIGSDGLTAAGAIAYLETRPKGFPITGRAKQASLALSYPVIRSFHRSADVSLGVDGLNSDNAAFGNLIASERTRAVRLAAGVVDARPRRSVSLSGSVSRGIDVLGARVTAPLAETGFTKATVALAINQAIGQRLVARLSGSAQYTRDRLPAAERFAIGGATIGRAFDTALLSGDRGAGGLAELAIRPIKATRFATSELYTFVDTGTVTVLDRGTLPERHFTLASTGVGVRARYRDKAELGLEGARSINDPFRGYAEDWRLSVAWRVSL